MNWYLRKPNEREEVGMASPEMEILTLNDMKGFLTKELEQIGTELKDLRWDFKELDVHSFQLKDN